jgi:RHS repeat-associated protein
MGTGQSQRTSEATTTSPTKNATFDSSLLGMYQAKLPNGDTPLYDREPGGRLDGRRTQAGGHDYYIDDGNGSPVALIGGSGNLEIANTYDPYGNRTACLVSQQGCASTGLTDAVGFNSSFLDCFNTQNSSGDCSGSGLYKMGERYYNAKLGNWTQPDPIGGGYSFAEDDPVNRADPTGLLGVAPIQPESYDCPVAGCATLAHMLPSPTPSYSGAGDFSPGVIATTTVLEGIGATTLGFGTCFATGLVATELAIETGMAAPLIGFGTGVVCVGLGAAFVLLMQQDIPTPDLPEPPELNPGPVSVGP